MGRSAEFAKKWYVNFQSFKRLKNREDGSDVGDSWTKLIVTTQSSFWKTKSDRRDRFRPRIVEIGAILTIFEPFEVLLFCKNLEQIDEKIHMPLFGEFSRSSRDLYLDPLQIELSPVRLSKFFESGGYIFRGSLVVQTWYDDMMIQWWW